MHRTPGRDACRRTKTLEGCQPFERVTSVFLLPFSYRIFLFASLPPESRRDRGREISAGSLPSSRDAELFRVVDGTLRRSSNQPFIRRCPTFSSREFSRVYREQGKSVRVALPWRIIPSNCAPRQLGQTFILRELSASCSIGPRRIRPRSRKHLSSPFSSKAIDRDKEPQTLPCRRCEFLPLVPLRPNSPWSSPIFPALRGLKAPSGGSVASDGIAANKRPGWQFRVSQLSPLLPAASQFTIKMSLSHYLAPRLALKAFDVTFHLPGTATASPKRCVD